MANPYSKYTGARVQPVPTYYYRSLGKIGEMYERGLASAGKAIGGAIESYYEKKSKHDAADEQYSNLKGYLEELEGGVTVDETTQIAQPDVGGGAMDIAAEGELGAAAITMPPMKGETLGVTLEQKVEQPEYESVSKFAEKSLPQKEATIKDMLYRREQFFKDRSYRASEKEFGLRESQVDLGWERLKLDSKGMEARAKAAEAEQAAAKNKQLWDMFVSNRNYALAVDKWQGQKNKDKAEREAANVRFLWEKFVHDQDHGLKTEQLDFNIDKLNEDKKRADIRDRWERNKWDAQRADIDFKRQQQADSVAAFARRHGAYEVNTPVTHGFELGDTVHAPGTLPPHLESLASPVEGQVTRIPGVDRGEITMDQHVALNMAPDLETAEAIMKEDSSTDTPLPASLRIIKYLDATGGWKRVQDDPNFAKLLGISPSAFKEKMDWLEEHLPEDITLGMVATAQGGFGDLASKQALFNHAKLTNDGSLTHEDLFRIIMLGRGITDKTKWTDYQNLRSSARSDEDRARVDSMFGVPSKEDMLEQKLAIEFKEQQLDDLERKAKEPDLMELVNDGKVTHRIPGVGLYVFTSPNSGYLKEDPETGGDSELPSATLYLRWQGLQEAHTALARGVIVEPGQHMVRGVALKVDPAKLGQSERNKLTMMGHILTSLEHRMGFDETKRKGYLDYSNAKWDATRGKWVDKQSGGNLPIIRYAPPPKTGGGASSPIPLLPLPNPRNPQNLLPRRGP